MYIKYVCRVCLCLSCILVWCDVVYNWYDVLFVVWYIGCVAVWYDMMAGYYACTHVPQRVSAICIVVLTLCVCMMYIGLQTHEWILVCVCNVWYSMCMYVVIVYVVYLHRIVDMKLYGVVYIHRCICTHVDMCDVSGRMSEWELWNIHMCMYIEYVYRICMFIYSNRICI